MSISRSSLGDPDDSVRQNPATYGEPMIRHASAEQSERMERYRITAKRL